MAVTVKIDELLAEFGTYLGTNEAQILRDLTQPTESMKYMRTVKQNDDFRASQAIIASIVQGFQKGWTPKGTPEFTPITIPHHRHKFDVAFYPDEIYGSFLGFLADETLDRKDWPFTKYILNKLLLDRVAEDRELQIIGNGTFRAPVEGQAQATGLSMDGFLTILQAAYSSGTSKMKFSTANSIITAENAFDQFEKFADTIQGVYKTLKMNVFCAPEKLTHYVRKKRDVYGANVDYKAGNPVIEGTNLTITPLPSMTGTEIIFATPQANFIRLLKMNDGASRPFIEASKREVFIYADWHENIGFAMEEVVFAFVPDAASASASE